MWGSFSPFLLGENQASYSLFALLWLRRCQHLNRWGRYITNLQEILFFTCIDFCSNLSSLAAIEIPSQNEWNLGLTEWTGVFSGVVWVLFWAKQLVSMKGNPDDGYSGLLLPLSEPHFHTLKHSWNALPCILAEDDWQSMHQQLCCSLAKQAWRWFLLLILPW